MNENLAPTILENTVLRLEFDRAVGGLRSVTNKLTGETVAVGGDAFAVETTAFGLLQADLEQVEWTATAETLTVRYAHADLVVEGIYILRPADHFFQKRLAFIFTHADGVRQITVSRPAFTLTGLELVCCRHPDFAWLTDFVHAKYGVRLQRPAGSEPSRTFFGRTGQGGFFTGLMMPYDNSRQDLGTLTLGYAPSLKVAAGERLEGEAMYFGVYRRSEADARAAEWKPIPAAALLGVPEPTVPDKAMPPVVATLPQPSESVAMTAMVSTLFGPPRHGMVALACGWHCQMEQDAYASDEALEADLRSLEFLASLGLDGVSDPHPWSGETDKLAQLREGDRYVLDARVRRFLDHARELGLKVTQWPTMNNTHPWRPGHGKPLRLDHPEWLRGVEGEPLPEAMYPDCRRRLANCLACTPFCEWLEKIIIDDALGTGLYESWMVDGDFWGTDAFFPSIVPVTCLADNHEHLPGDANYACQRWLAQLFAKVRERHPRIYIGPMCRPAMDLGVWAMRHVDACFTLIESGTGTSNISAGNQVRTASRIRVHHQFFPHWLDTPLLFPSYADPQRVPAWPSAKIDYLMLSALSCSPNLLLYLPTKSGIPEADKAEIRKWLDWGRANVEYLFVRHDLFDWPGKGVVDGSAHLQGNRGLIFLFNSEPVEMMTEFALTADAVGFTGTEAVEIRQEYPAGNAKPVAATAGAVVRWRVPPETALVLRLTK